MTSTDSALPGGTMAAMPPSQARDKNAAAAGLWAAWAIVIVAGGITMTYNIWHATHVGHMLWPLALLYGIGPVTLAALLSHVVAEYECGRVMKGIAFAAMIGALAMSVGATAWVIGPTAGPELRWVFGAVLDVATLAALRVILDARSRKAKAAAEAETARAVVAEATGKAARLETELTAVRAETSAELETVRAELAAAASALEALRNTAPLPRTKRSKRATPQPRKSADTQDLTTELRAMQMLDAHPELRAKGQGAELARRLGVHPSTGRRLLAQLTSEERPSEGAHERAHERSASAAHERSESRAQERS